MHGRRRILQFHQPEYRANEFPSDEQSDFPYGHLHRESTSEYQRFVMLLNRSLQPITRILLVPILASLLPGSVGTITPVPATVSFSPTTPDSSGTVPVALSWQITGGSNTKTWNITVAAGGSTLTNCTTIPASAITVICSSSSVSGGGTGACSGSFPLSTTPQQFAGGQQATGTANYSVNVTYQFTDAWKYQATGAPTCQLNLSYLVTQN